MSKSATTPTTTTPSILAARAAAYVGHTHIRLRGEQTGTIGVCNARTATASISLRLGTVLMTFWSAAASQGVLEAVAAARNGLTAVPDTIAAAADPYGTLAIAVDWTTRPSYAVVPQTRTTEDRRHTLRWVDVHMGPLTVQILDRAAHRSLTDLLREVHRTAIAVFLDGAEHAADPDADDYTPGHTDNR
ncbi:MAG: hypothetical protein QG597_488 [Actinomycetota bacterium]|mgnify:CR=1 FL=1|nr:hypothetical protein [Actinomycetota bacterium]